MPYWRSLLFLVLLWTDAVAANIQGIPTSWIYVNQKSSYDAMTKDNPNFVAPFFGQLNGQNGFNPAHLGAKFTLPYVDRQNAFGIYAWDDMPAYSNGQQLLGLNNGAGYWPSLTNNTSYVDRFNYLPLLVYDNLVSYSPAVLAGLDDCYACTNNSSGVLILKWNGPYVEGNFPVTVGCVDQSCFTNGAPPNIGFDGNYSSFCTVSVYYTLDGSTPTTNSASVFMSPGCGGGALPITDPTFGVKAFAFGPLLHGPVVTANFCSLGTCWSNQVVLNSGANPSYASVTNINNWWSGVIADWTALGTVPTVYSLNLMATDSLVALQTPQIWSNRPSPGTGAQFGGIWTNHNFVAGDVTANGLTGLAGSTKYLDTGWAISSFNSAQSVGISWYAYNATTTGSDGGAYNGAITGVEDIAKYVDSKTYSLNGANANSIIIATSGNGFYSSQRTANNVHKLYFATSGSAWAQIGATETTVWNGAFPALNYFVMADDNNGAAAIPSSDTLSTVVITDGLDSAHGQALYNRTQTWRQSQNGGFR